MGVQFNAYDPATGVSAGGPVDMSFPTAQRIGSLLGLPFVTASEADGECTLAELRAGLERWPEGHKDRLINQRFGELLKLLIAAEKTNQDLRIVWG